MPRETRFLTVDIVLKGTGETEHLVAALEAMDYVVSKHDWDDGNKWHLNISCPYVFDQPDTCVLRCCADLDSLPEDAKVDWRLANFRAFSIGYESGEQPLCFESHIGVDTIQQPARLGAGIGIALYAVRPEPPVS